MLQGLNELINSTRTNIGIKRMGVIDEKAFVNTFKQRLPLEEAQTKAVELCSLWQENLKNPNWHPFKVITVDNKPEAICFLCSYYY